MSLLRDTQIRALNSAGYHRVDSRLYLQVTVNRTGAVRKSWIFRYRLAGKSSELGLGPYPVVSLATALSRRDTLLLAIDSGEDPREALGRKARAMPAKAVDQEHVERPLFVDFAERVHATLQHEWRNAKHADQWLSSIRNHALPHLRHRHVDEVTDEDILAILRPIWHEKTETAYRLRDRLFKVLEAAERGGLRQPDPLLRSRVRHALPQAKKLIKQKRVHHAALPYNDVPTFIRTFNSSGCSDAVKLLHEFTILNGNRSGEARGARWSEIDFAQRRWIIDRSRMKTGEEHRIPLSSRALEILHAAERLRRPDSDLVFPSPLLGRMISDAALTVQFKKMGYRHTVHGYRSSMRDWAAERTHFAWEVMEKALAHKVGGETELAYFRSDLFEKRREMMEAWAQWCGSTSR